MRHTSVSIAFVAPSVLSIDKLHAYVFHTLSNARHDIQLLLQPTPILVGSNVVCPSSGF